MKRTTAVVMVLSAALSSMTAERSPADATTLLRPAELLARASSFVGKTVEVEIVEPLGGPTTPESLARTEYGQVRVEMPELGGSELVLVPATYRPEDPDRYRRKFDRVLLAPLRIRGELLEDRELRHGERRNYVLRVLSLEALPLAAPVKVASVEEVLADRSRFDRSTIEISGTFESRFEVSALEKKIWLSRAPNARIVGKPDEKATMHTVRVVGVLFAAPEAHYGHLGAYPLMLVAREIEYR